MSVTSEDSKAVDQQPSKFPAVTAIIPAYNSAHLLPRCIASIVSQTVPVTEIIVVDDASQRSPSTELERFGDRVRLIRRLQNGGPSAARNDGIRTAEGEWIALLDADDRWLPNKLERQLALAALHPEAALIYSDVTIVNPDDNVMTNYLTGKNPQSGAILSPLIDEIFILPSSVLARKANMLQAGCFDETLRGTEDHDLWLRMSLRGDKMWFVPEALVLYQRQQKSLSKDWIQMLGYRIRVWDKLLAVELSAKDRDHARRKLAEFHFRLAYYLRGQNPSGSIHHAWSSVKLRPTELTYWKSTMANIVLAAAGRRGRPTFDK